MISVFKFIVRNLSLTYSVVLIIALFLVYYYPFVRYILIFQTVIVFVRKMNIKLVS